MLGFKLGLEQSKHGDHSLKERKRKGEDNTEKKRQSGRCKQNTEKDPCLCDRFGDKRANKVRLSHSMISTKWPLQLISAPKENILTAKEKPWAWETAQRVKYSGQAWGPEFQSPAPHKGPGEVECACDQHWYGGKVDREIPGAPWLASQPNHCKLQFQGETLSQKWGREWQIRTSHHQALVSTSTHPAKLPSHTCDTHTHN